MRVFITGASGFVGASTLRLLLDAGHEVGTLVRNKHSTWRIQAVMDRVQLIEGDMSHAVALEASISRFQPEAILHLAWSGVGGRERNRPEQWHNVREAMELVEIAARCGAKHWIGLGSQAEYGPCANRIGEDTPARPTTLYGASKLATALLAEPLCKALGMRFAWLRLFSSYGPRDNPDWLIPGMVRSLAAGKRPAVTNAEQLWDYIHVDDVAAAIVAVLETSTACGIFNLGSGRALPLRRIIEKIRDLAAPGAPIGFGEIPYRDDQVMHLEADISRLQAATGWKPSITMDSGLPSTVEWFINNP